jgi:hypothetical protein
VRLFIHKAIIFIFPIALFVVVSEYIVRQVPNDYSYKNEYLHSNSKDIETLVLGSSHSFYGINPDFFSRSAFNAAHVSQSLNYDFFIFNKYINKLSNLKTLILPISYFTLFSQLENGKEHWRVKNYAIYYDYTHHDNVKYNYETIGEKPLILLKKAYKHFKGSNNITVSELGFGLNYSNVKQSDLMATGEIAAKRHTQSNLDLLDTNLGLLNKLITGSNENGIRVVLFTPPARKSYISHLNENQLSVMKSSIADMIRGKSNVEYYDFMNDSRFVNEDFKDADHLNGVGAKKLTKLIDRIILDKTKLTHIEGMK